MKTNENKKWGQTYVNVIKNKTLLIVGYGNIGESIAKIAKYGFDMKVIAIKKRPGNFNREIIDEMYGEESLIKCLEKADYVVNALPSTKDTYDYFDKSKFEKNEKKFYLY